MTTAVVIPVYNRGHLLRHCLASIQQQTLPIDQVIIVDDASTDDTRRAILEIAQENSAVVPVLLDINSGAAAARNAGVAATDAEWIAFLDSDDTWLPHKHAAQVDALSGRPDAVASFTSYTAVEGDVRHPAVVPEIVSMLDLRGSNVVGTTSTALVRRDALVAVGGFDETLPSCQDWDLWMRLRMVGDFAIVAEPLVDFTQDSSGRISRNIAAVQAGHGIVFKRALAGVDDARFRRVIGARHQLRMAQIFIWDMLKPGRALVHALKSLALHPTADAWSMTKMCGKRLVRNVTASRT